MTGKQLDDTRFHKGDRVRIIADGEYYNEAGEIFHIERAMDGQVYYTILIDYVYGKGKKAQIKRKSVTGFTHNAIVRD